jgi:hypothetical protein
MELGFEPQIGVGQMALSPGVLEEGVELAGLEQESVLQQQLC